MFILLQIGLSFFFIGFAIASLLWNLKRYFNQVVSNVFTPRDYRQVLITLFVAGCLLWGLIIHLYPIRSFPDMFVPLAILTMISIALTELFRQARAYMRPGDMRYRPYKVRYWPSWIIRKREILLNESTVIEFGLAEATFDLNLILFSNTSSSLQPNAPSRQFLLKELTLEQKDKLLETLDIPLKELTLEQKDKLLETLDIPLKELTLEQKDKLLETLDIPYPYKNHQEMAITDSGYFRQNKPIVTILCEAPGFEISQEKTQIDIASLRKNPIPFTLLPKSIGKKYILFKLLDSQGIVRGSVRVECEIYEDKSKVKVLFQRIIIGVGTVLGMIATILLIIEKVRQFFP
jgi:hypothetical protein